VTTALQGTPLARKNTVILSPPNADTEIATEQMDPIFVQEFSRAAGAKRRKFPPAPASPVSSPDPFLSKTAQIRLSRNT
jgi:hypothetical protein